MKFDIGGTLAFTIMFTVTLNVIIICITLLKIFS